MTSPAMDRALDDIAALVDRSRRDVVRRLKAEARGWLDDLANVGGQANAAYARARRLVAAHPDDTWGETTTDIIRRWRDQCRYARDGHWLHDQGKKNALAPIVLALRYQRRRARWAQRRAA